MLLGTSWGTHWEQKKKQKTPPPPTHPPQTKLLCLPSKETRFCQHGYLIIHHKLSKPKQICLSSFLMDIIEESMGGMEGSFVVIHIQEKI